MKYGTVLAQKPPPASPNAGPVMEEAFERKWISRFSAGQYVYGPKWARLVRRLQCELVLRAQGLGFDECIFPRFIPREALDSFGLTQFAPDVLVAAGPNSFLDPVQCVSFYHHLRGRVLSRAQLPARVVEVMGGWSWRNETTERMDGVYRAREFLRVEHVYCGAPQQVRDLRRQVRDSLTDFLTRLQLGWQVVVGRGCMDMPWSTEMTLTAKLPDDVPVQDIEVPIRHILEKLPDLPAPGTTCHDAIIDGELVQQVSDSCYLDHDEISGCSVEGEHLTRSFGLVDEDGIPLWSGCCGIGLNRLMLALLYQHGFDKVDTVVEEAIGQISDAHSLA